MTSRGCAAYLLCQKAVLVRTTCRAMSAAAHPQSQVDRPNGASHRKLQGGVNLKMVRLPEELQTAALSIIHGARVKHLKQRALSLTNFLWSRKRAVEDLKLRQKAMGLEKELWEKAMEKRDSDEQAVEDQIRRKVLSELKRTTYHRTPQKFDEELGVVYMAARLAGGYAAVRRALNEIKKRDPTFSPQTLLDFGSGLGSVAWASHSFWGDTLKEMVCVDISSPMNDLAERLLKGDDESAEPHMKQVYFRQFLPVSPKVQFDLVVAAFTLSELRSAREREDAVFTLWRKTSSYLVLIENGTKEGHQMLMDARETLLTKQEKAVHDPRPASVFAPCPHELQCPKLVSNPPLPCNFTQTYHPLPLPGQANGMTERFSYVILSRAGVADPGAADAARLVAPVLKRSRHIHCRLCCPDGQLRHVIVTARKHSRDIYRCARSRDWGDQLPIIEQKDGEVQADD